MGLVTSVWASNCWWNPSVRHQFVSALVADLQLSGQDSFRCAPGFCWLATASPGWTHPSGTTAVEQRPRLEKNGIITRLKAKNMACSIHQLSVGTREDRLKNECEDGGRRGQRVGHKLKTEIIRRGGEMMAVEGAGRGTRQRTCAR